MIKPGPPPKMLNKNQNKNIPLIYGGDNGDWHLLWQEFGKTTESRFRILDKEALRLTLSTMTTAKSFLLYLKIEN